MEKSAPSRFAKVKELIDQLRISVQLDSEMTAILEDLHGFVYAVQEDNKRLVATVRRQDERINSLEKRYSELLYNFSQFKQQLPK